MKKSNTKQGPEFGGFKQSNTTPVPDILFDELLSKLSGSELKVLLYIIRRTAGFKKTSDSVSLTQFEKGIITKKGKVLDHGCGLNDRETINNALKSLENKGYIVSEKHYRRDGGNAPTSYRIRFEGEEVVGKTDQGASRKNRLPKTQKTLVGKTDQASRKNPKPLVGKTDPQQTVIQETVIQQTGGNPEPVQENPNEENTQQFSPPVSSFSDSNQENYPIANKTTDISPSIVSEPPLEPRKEKEPLTTVEQAFEAYDDALRASHIVDSSFKQTPRTKDNIGWMQALIEQGATREGILNAMESLATDCDTFYRKNIRPKFFSENYVARVGMAVREKKAQSVPKEKSHNEQVLEARRAEWNKWMSPTPSNASL